MKTYNAVRITRANGIFLATLGSIRQILKLTKYFTMKLYYQNKRAEQYQVEFTSKNNDAINVLIDQLNRDGITFIKSDQFNTDVKLMTIDIMDADSKYKVGELTFNESYLGEDRSVLEI